MNIKLLIRKALKRGKEKADINNSCDLDEMTRESFRLMTLITVILFFIFGIISGIILIVTL